MVMSHWGEDTDVALRLRLYRGNQLGMPNLEIAELGFTKDSEKVWVGTSKGNVKLISSDDNEYQYILNASVKHTLAFILPGALASGVQPPIIRLPYKASVVGIYAVCGTPGTTETQIDVEVNNQAGVDTNTGWASIMTTKLSVDANEISSYTAASQPVISTVELGKYTHIRLNATQVGTGISNVNVIVDIAEVVE